MADPVIQYGAEFCIWWIGPVLFVPDEQFGFLEGRSSELQLLATLETWHESLDSRNHVHCILLDAAKAFDRVDHTALLRILQSIGLDTVSLKWFFSYLSGRCILEQKLTVTPLYHLL